MHTNAAAVSADAVTSVACAGLGTVSSHTFATFKCRVGWRFGYVPPGTATVWARSRADGLCTSSASLAMCPAVVLPGDPNVRKTCPAAPNADACDNLAAVAAARAAVAKQFALSSWSGPFDCDARAPTLTCAFRDGLRAGTVSVTLKPGSAGWTRSVKISVSCTAATDGDQNCLTP